MYTTFTGMAPAADSKSSAPSSPQAPQHPKPRPKRSQVARACDWCRVHRIKCDNHLPCSNCKRRGGRCIQGEVEVRTLPHAYRKIEHLENRVKELEQELENERKASRSGVSLDTPLTTPSSVTSSAHSDTASVSASDSLSDHGSGSERKTLCEGVHIRSARSQQETWYGPSSLFYFLRRVNTFMNTSLRETRPINRMLPDSANKLFDVPSQNTPKEQSPRATPSAGGDGVTMGDYLTPTQEEYFISRFWETYHTALPVLDEVAFKEHYQSLWTTSNKERKPSALVDIVIAICMQYAMALQPGAGHAGNGDNENTIAGRWHYQRCQRLLSNELENPTLSTLQCHILSTSFLCFGSFQNMADSTCTLAVRTAFMLGLHLEPPEDMPKREREMRKRLWWGLYVLDSKISMKLGRPFLLDYSDATCSLPGHDFEAAMLSGSVFPPLGEDVTWLTFNFENIKLFKAVRAAYTAFYRRQINTPSASGEQENSKIIESHAEFLAPYIERIEDWVKNVPSALETRRIGNGTPFSTEFTSLEIEPFASPWLQRQRLVLELMYHNLCINLFRPFIRFTPSTTPTPTADKAATRCAAHAVALTRIMHQVLSSTTILSGWLEAFQWQWNAAMSLVGFAIAYPRHPEATAARDAIDLSVAVFGICGRSFAPAASAAGIARDLGAQADILAKQAEARELVSKTDRSVKSESTLPDAPGSGNLGAEVGGAFVGNDGIVPGAWGGGGEDEGMQDFLAESIDMAFSVDSQDFGMALWPGVDVNMMNMNMSNDPQWGGYWPQQV
ncbi:fungal-specific transcription factor domain-containing protein [Hypoxylon trugodes]|uniref:fungal-specific transcription factor domain-containing protein n=1 Tax=Hypoxylon trugodes TaxID=326681 RepID=UPI0021A184E8|nr:fungal-specific transcription factor domain-containing protein [Hypoxylon trugodes]KAI1393331.1 fungal-specific transcription factor domain-containing protein [Hypoxylon trugodes]